MASYHGNDGEFHVGANAVLEVKSFQHTNTGEWADKSAAGDAARSYLPGKKDGSGSLNVHLDPGDTTGQGALVEGATATVTLYPSGTATGRKKLEGTIYIESVSTEMDQDDINARTVSYKGYLAESVVA